MSTSTLSKPITPVRLLGRLAPAILPLAAAALLSIGQGACAEGLGEPDMEDMLSIEQRASTQDLGHVGVAQRIAPLGLKPDEGSLREVSPGVLQFTASGAVFHLLGEGKHLVGGTLIELDGRQHRNLTYDRLMETRAEALSELFEGDLLIFPAAGEKRQRLYVFTDPTCGFCQKFHDEVPALNAAGIEVAYVPFARGATAGPGYEALQAAWCSKNARAAYSALIQAPTVLDAPGVAPVDACSLVAAVSRANVAAVALGVRGTPALLTPDAQQLGGYLSADAVLQALAIAP